MRLCIVAKKLSQKTTISFTLTLTLLITKTRMDTKKIIRDNISGLYILIEETEQNFSWSSVNKSFSKHLDSAKKRLQENGTFQKDTNLFSLLVEKLHGEGKGNAMLDFYNQLFISLSENLNLDEKKLIHKTLKNILTNNDKDYIHFIGELATLNEIIKTKEYILKGVEYPIINKKGITSDFLLIQKSNNLEIYLEVLNIHLHEKEFQSYSEIEYHLNSKYEIKKKEKIISLDKKILIQPVFWTKSESQLKQLSEFYNNSNFIIENILTPLTYSSWKSNNIFEHKFENIKTILND